ncbi:MAG: hypothetical protein PPFGHCPK_01326 [Spiroplasma endosymbiont of Drosophila atripex]|nr:MAG: hypothetical protein PPFGHCPK_00030 [Spiroplasma endosymbiont of Drosophila atripex]WDA53871.1 MAG: hypothetical protein PPFGHCPK_00285 [Spiroplasma endosymbiont of Drosophila atripex]WDA54619.1 MAG: hypothetical protein PPFGHCPK_01075 [Spiroplasma endosymbiont of Drosophila atripex]WDA54845.1 MAG: hypothetical protein PPFGHCPK_01326 [Spiroplasma endosymbiont of Drosophila atripex]
MNKEKLLEYYYDKLKQHERNLDELRLNEGIVKNLLIEAQCIIERINKGEFDND